MSSRAGAVLNWLEGIPRDRRYFLPLALINLAGAVYGFYWYRDQLLSTPPWAWPLVADSPLAVLAFGFYLLSLHRGGRRFPLLEAYALLTTLKYGLWTDLVIGQSWLAGGQVIFEDVHLLASHFGMALEAFLFLRYFAPPLPYGLLVSAWLVLNDYVDYARGLHPNLPDPNLVGSVAVIASFLTVTAALAFVWFANAARRLR